MIDFDFILPSQPSAWCIVMNGTNILLGKRSDNCSSPNKWNFFGGKLNQGETAISCAVRELNEEANISATEEQFIYICDVGNCSYFAYVVDDSFSDYNVSNEISEFKWVDCYNYDEVRSVYFELHKKTKKMFDKGMIGTVSEVYAKLR